MKITMKLLNQDLESDEIMNIKLLHIGNTEHDGCLGNVRLEMTSDDDIFFHYSANICNCYETPEDLIRHKDEKDHEGVISRKQEYVPFECMKDNQ